MADQRDAQAMVQEFHEAFGIALGGSWRNEDRRRLRRALIREEFREYCDAENADDAHATLDALVDLTYVIIGAALEYGWDFAGAFAAVHAANMAKLGLDGEPIMRDDGKVLKPEGWAPADLAPFLGESPRGCERCGATETTVTGPPLIRRCAACGLA